MPRKPAVVTTPAINADQRDHAIRRLATLMLERASVTSRLGKGYNDIRQLYDALGYPLNPTFEDFMAKFKRHPIGRAIINIPVDRSWRKHPTITEGGDDQSPLELAWKNMTKQRGGIPVIRTLMQADKMSGIGSYAVVVVGFADGNALDQPCEYAERVAYLTPYSEAAAKIERWDEEPTSPRFGQPVLYAINPMANATGRNRASTQAKRAFRAHYTRVLHVPGDTLENQEEGMSRLEASFNSLIALEQILGASGEGYWRGAYHGTAAILDKDARRDDLVQTIDEMEEQLKKIVHSFDREYQLLQGVELKQLLPAVLDPTPFIQVHLDVIAAETRIPKRIMVGSERGQLASDQDERGYDSQMEVRRIDRNEPVLLRGYIDMCLNVGALPPEQDMEVGYTVEWEPLVVQGEKEKSEIASNKSKALSDYITSGASSILAPAMFLEKVMGLTKEEIEQNDLMLLAGGFDEAGSRDGEDDLIDNGGDADEEGGRDVSA